MTAERDLLERIAESLEQIETSLALLVQAVIEGPPAQPTQPNSPSRNGHGGGKSRPASTPPQRRTREGATRSAFCGCECGCWRKFADDWTGDCCDCEIESYNAEGLRACGCQRRYGDERLIHMDDGTWRWTGNR